MESEARHVDGSVSRVLYDVSAWLKQATIADLEREILKKRRHPREGFVYCSYCNVGRSKLPWVQRWVACEGRCLPAWTGFVIRDDLPDHSTTSTGCALCLPIPLNVPVHFLFWLATRWTRRLRAWWREHGR